MASAIALLRAIELLVAVHEAGPVRACCASTAALTSQTLAATPTGTATEIGACTVTSWRLTLTSPDWWLLAASAGLGARAGTPRQRAATRVAKAWRIGIRIMFMRSTLGTVLACHNARKRT